MFVLSYVLPPEEGAAFGKATVYPPLTAPGSVHRRVVDFLAHEHVVPVVEADAFATALARELTGTERVHTGTGITFRIDPERRAPNTCPCCGRLVNWQDHELAGSDDAYCLGCFTWKRNVPQCLPENSAHTEEP